MVYGKRYIIGRNWRLGHSPLRRLVSALPTQHLVGANLCISLWSLDPRSAQLIAAQLRAASPSAVPGQLGTRQQFEVLAAAPATSQSLDESHQEEEQQHQNRQRQQPQHEIAYLMAAGNASVICKTMGWGGGGWARLAATLGFRNLLSLRRQRFHAEISTNH